MSKPYIPQKSRRFDLDIEIAVERGYDISALKKLMDLLVNRKRLNSKYNDHALQGRLEGLRDAHISNDPDWILIYRYLGNNKIKFERTGTHSDIFNTTKQYH